MPNSGYTSVPTPTTMAGATANRVMPTAHFLTVPLQAFGSDFTVHVMARAPNGIASVEFFHENPTTTTVTASQLNTIIKADGTTKTRDTFAINLNGAAWTADPTKMTSGKLGGNIYAKVTANPVAGVTMLPRIIGPLRLTPRPLVNGLPNDYVALVTPDGKDNSGNAVVAPSNGAVFASLALAEAAMTTGAGAAASAPMIKFMKTGTYEIGVRSTSLAFRDQPCWFTITHAPGVVATIGRASAPNYSDKSTWPWLISRGLVEFRGPGIVLDHRNWTYAQTDTGQSMGAGYAAFWDNGCKHTLVGVASVTDPTSGLSSPLYNMYWNAGPHPGNNTPSNASDFDPGIYATDATYEWIVAGVATRATPLVDGCTFKETSGDIAVNNLCVLHNYARGQVTSFFDPGITPALTVRYSGTGAGTIQKTGLNGNGTIVLVSNGVAQAPISLGQVSTDPNFTLTQLAASINSHSGWAATVNDTTSGLGARWIVGGSDENSMPATDAKTAALVFKLIVAVHTEWIHFSGGDWADGVWSHQDNFLIMNNVLRSPARCSASLASTTRGS